MKGFTHFLTSLIVFVAGIVLIVMHRHINIIETIVMVIGAALILPGLLRLAIAAFSRRAERRAELGRSARFSYVCGLVASVFAVILGIAMLLDSAFFAGIIAYLFAALLIAAGFYHIMAVSYLARPYILPFYFYIIPLLLIVAGFVILFTGVRVLDAVMVLIMGIAMVASSINTLLEYIGTHPSRSAAHTPEAAEELPEHTDDDTATPAEN